ncbi:phenylacetate--CoA ligase family protein [Microvirga terrae]|uniref:Phenylacetate--CoA ligase family protein n=1 Tax=Microvirga terrae TaxID=2740529 RepID=A0ABY5RLC8_9HYPH|nr:MULTISPECIES: phenylacetate--CoA ligase family protein [Microvirga]MBQ0821977.1 phenylacetate--CoA ligase family protein [Microvirga sp. HBU67558]UVF17597.1 phenylacetate--CoA ligase family protein [Microvirga terrae]
MSVEQRRQVQLRRLTGLLRHAARHVPYYQELLHNAKVVRNGMVDLSRFGQIPELTRNLLRDQFEHLKSDDLDLRSWYRRTTGGSTGEPVVVLQDRSYDDIGRAVKDLHYEWAGRASGEPLVALWGSERDILMGSEGWRNKLSGFIRNQTLLNSWNMTKADLQRYAETLQRIRPAVIEAYAESIYALARYLNETGTRIDGVRSVISSAGTLYPFIRHEVENAFKCPVLNRYGSREVGDIAAETTSGSGLDVFSYVNLVEVVDENGHPCGPGEEGDVLVTSLTNYSMPLIRYRLGDRAIVGAAATIPIHSVDQLQAVTGRILDALVREDGSTVPATFFMHFLSVVHNSGWIRKTQVIQKDYNRIMIKMITTAAPTDHALDEIRNTLQRVMGKNCRIDFDFVDDIPASPSGKYRYTITHLPRSDSGTSTDPVIVDVN